MKNCPIVARDSSHVIGVLRGWDRLVFRGCVPLLSYLDAMLLFLRHLGVLLKDYSEWALRLDASFPACARRTRNDSTGTAPIGPPFKRNGRRTFVSTRPKRSAASTARWCVAP